MLNDSAKITLEYVTRGMENVKRAQEETARLKETTDRAAESHLRASQLVEKHAAALANARQVIVAFRMALLPVAVAIGVVSGGLKLATASSDALQERMEALGSTIKNTVLNALNPAANALARFFGNQGKLSRGTRIDILGMQSETAKLRGDELTALLKRQEAERIKLLEGATEERKRIIGKELEARQQAEREALRLQQLGLKNQLQVFNDFKKDLVGSLRGSTSDTLFNIFEGNKQSGEDIRKNFRSGIHRAISEALSQSLFSSIFGGGGFSSFFENFKNILTGKNKTEERIAEYTERTAQILTKVQDCICRTAENTAAMASQGVGAAARYEGTITPPGTSVLGKIGAISNLVGSVASIGAGAAGGMGGAKTGGYNNPSGNFANITMGGGQLGHAGGYVRAYSAGGEIPMTAQGGEFIVRKSVAMRNKGFLKEFNSGGGSSMGSNHFYVNIKANDSKSFDEQLGTSSGRERIQFQVIRSIMMNSEIRRVIKDFAR